MTPPPISLSTLTHLDRTGTGVSRPSDTLPTAHLGLFGPLPGRSGQFGPKQAHFLRHWSLALDRGPKPGFGPETPVFGLFLGIPGMAQIWPVLAPIWPVPHIPGNNSPVLCVILP